MTLYHYTASGTAAGNQTWEVSGLVEVPTPDLRHALDVAQRALFLDLTQGKAVFGQPGVGCAGPYRVISFSLELQSK